jgi:multiple sugar transport system substrate-binding protein
MPELRVAVRKFGPFEEAIRRQFDDFVRVERLCDLSMRFDALDLGPLTEALFDRGGLVDGSCDIAFLNTDWLARALHDRCLLDLSPWMDRLPVPDYPAGWSPSLSNLPHRDGGVFGLPYHDGPQCLIYRADLIAAPPATWDDFAAAARAAADPSAGRYGTVLAGFPDGHNAVYDFCIHLWTRGGELLDPAGRPALNCPAARDGLSFYRALARDPATVPAADTIDSVRSGNLFADGRVAMMTNWFGFAAMSQALDTSTVRGRVGIAPIPAGPGGRSCSLNVYYFLSVARGSRQPELAYRFIRHCLRPEMDKLLTLAGACGCRLST